MFFGPRDEDASRDYLAAVLDSQRELPRTRFELAKRKLGFAGADERYELNTHAFKPPRPKTPQLSLGFD